MDIEFTHRLLPICVFEDADLAKPAAEAFLEAGLDLIEIPCRTPAALDAISTITAHFPEMRVGAGSLLSPEAIRKAIDAGAVFGVAPGIGLETISAAREAGFPFIPGVMTPTDIQMALDQGCDLLKVFPASLAGGPAYLSAIAEPFRETPARYIPVGGVTLENAPEYLAMPCVSALGGTFMAPQALIRAQDWDGLRTTIREALVMVDGCSARLS